MNRLDEIQRGLDARLAVLDNRLAARSSPSLIAKSSVAVPTLSASDLRFVRDIAFQAVGFAPGAKVTNLPHDFSPDLRTVMLTVAEIAGRESMPIGSATLSVVRSGASIGRQSLPFAVASVFQDGIPAEGQSVLGDAVLDVAKGAAYFARRLDLAPFGRIVVLWADVDVTCDLDSRRLTVDYAMNAFSSTLERGGRLAALCLSPRVTDFSVICHELTHSVSHDVIGWGEFYACETGAVNESCADIFAKFAEFAWHGYDPSDPNRWRISTFRDMAHPSSMPGKKRRAPDYYLEPPDEDSPNSGWMVVNVPDASNDYGGVHVNNGVLTRLCYLLCEGEAFTRKDGVRFDVQAIGLIRTEELFQRAFLTGRYLTVRPSIYSVYRAMTCAAQDLAFTEQERRALQVACEAVNIIPPNAGNMPEGSRAMSFERRSLREFGEDLSEALPRAYSDELGLSAPGSGYVCEEKGTLIGTRGPERTLRYRQTFDGMPVFGATAVARVDSAATVTYLSSGFSRQLASVCVGDAVDAARASAIAREEFGGLATLACERVVFDPVLFGDEGAPAVAWHVTSGLPNHAESHCIVDASTGRLLFSAPLRIN